LQRLVASYLAYAIVRPSSLSVPEHETLATGRTAACHVGTYVLSFYLLTFKRDRKIAIKSDSEL